MATSEIDLHLHTKQADAFESPATEILWGGAAGGGKSHFSRAAAIMWCAQIPNLQVYIFRRHFDDVIKNHMEGPTGFRAMLAPWVDAGLVKITETEVRFLFNGSKIYLCHCQFDVDRWKYSGYEMHVLILEEGVQFPEVVIRFLRHRVRMPLSMQEALPEKFKGRFPRLIITSNPVGGEGRDYLKNAFVDARPALAIEQMPEAEGGFYRQFIPAKLTDNPSLDQAAYRANLMGLGSPEMVEAMLNGDWSAMVGAYFSMWHSWVKAGGICKPFAVPPNWTRFRSFDWGSAEPFSVGWWAVANGEQPSLNHLPPAMRPYFSAGALLRYREWYGQPPGKYNVGLRMKNELIAAGIVERSAGEKAVYTVTDSLPFQARGGETIAEVFAKGGVILQLGDVAPGSRVNGWQQIIGRMYGLDLDGRSIPMIYCFDTCRDSIRTIPQLPHNDHKPEDLPADGCECHAADEWRLAAASRPWFRAPEQERKPKHSLTDYTYQEMLDLYDNYSSGHNRSVL
jgi:hypothetical protein